MLFTRHTHEGYNYLLSLLTGILLWLAWPHTGWNSLIFIAWVPLLIAEERIRSQFGFFFFLWGAFLVWNVGATWWIWNSTGAGAAGAIVANSLIMCFPFMAYRFTKRKLGLTAGLAGFILYWLAYEYLHHNWELSWPWLTLGNSFANKPEWVKLYRFTGTSGGSLWVLLVNVILFNWWYIKTKTEKNSRIHILLVMVILLPIPIGVLLHKGPETMTAKAAKTNTLNVVVVQPNVEAYTEKFSTPAEVLTQRMIDLSNAAIDSNTRLVVWPETAIPSQAWENELETKPAFQLVNQFLVANPKVLLVTGIDSYILWGEDNPGGMSIRQTNSGQYYEAYNTAYGKSSGQAVQLYHKSKLVPGVESLPSWLGFMSPVFDEFGGTSGSLGRSNAAKVFSTPGNPFHPAPVICYESIYSDYVTQYIRQGANIITVITNDGWWGNTAGHHQHMHYARLRAIETGLWVARSANTGISCFIDPEGNIYQPQPWATQAVIKMAVPPVNNPTFYAKKGDWLSKGALVLALLLFALSLLSTFIWKKQ
jgi:apolipoprotein N-acyltransferase